MVFIRLLSNGGNKVRYSYQPEKDGKEGILAYDFSENKGFIEERAEKDGESGFYRSQVYRTLREAGIDNLPSERTLIWY